MNHTMTVKSALAVLLVALGMPLAALSANTFTAVSGADWNTAANWSDGVPIAGQEVVVDGNATLTNATPALASLTVNAGRTLTFDGWNTVLNATTVTIAGTVTHAINTATTTNALGQWIPNARVYIACSNISVAATGAIDANAKGFRGGTSPSSSVINNGAGPGGGLSGWWNNSLAGGGSHGGWGGKTGNGSLASGGVYGDPAAPLLPGSGGGAFNAGHPGYSGGGAVRIDASGDVAVDGRISANGGLRGNNVSGTSGTSEYGGAGSGGSIYITCRTLGGAAGAISADGEDGGHVSPNLGPGGGGGRVAIAYDPVAQAVRSGMVPSTVKVSAAGGVGNKAVSDSGRPGTIHLPNTDLLTGGFHGGEFLVPGFTSWSAESLVFGNGLTVLPAGFVLSVENDVVVTGNGEFVASNITFSIGGSLSIQNSPQSVPTIYGGGLSSFSLAGDLIIGKGRLDLYSDPAVEKTIDIGGSLMASNSAAFYIYSAPTGSVTATGSQVVSVGGDITVKDTARIYPTSVAKHGGSVMFTAANVLVEPNAAISAKGLGFRGQETVGVAVGYGPGRGMYGGGATASGGAGHGGVGGHGTLSSSPLALGGVSYGSISVPIEAGSSGGRAYSSDYVGGSGGGVIRLEVAGTATVNGLIDASANDGGQHCGGGSGGSVYIVCHTFHGGSTGRILADGGASNLKDSIGGGGAGGRIAIHYDKVAQATLPVQPEVALSADGGMQYHVNAARGNPGTIYTSDTVFFPSATLCGGIPSVPGFTEWTTPSLTVSGGWTRFPDGFRLTVQNNLTITGAKTRLSSTNGALYQIGGDISVSDGGVLDYTTVHGPSEITCGGDIALSSGGSAYVGTHDGLIPVEFAIGGDVSLGAGTAMYVYGAVTNAAGNPYGSLMNVGGNIAITGENAWIYPYSHSTNGGSVKWIARNVSIPAANSGFNADLKGFVGVITTAPNKTTGRGPGGGFGVLPSYSSGAGHGGMGGALRPDIAPAGVAYGDALAPTLPGSVGGRPGGGAGGGVVWIEAPDGTISLNGRITANAGKSTQDHSSGGSGGSIYLICRRYEETASASLQAKGGDTTATTGSNLGSGGAGGRIAVHSVFTARASENHTVAGGFAASPAGGLPGEIGTLVWNAIPKKETVIIVQ